MSNPKTTAENGGRFQKGNPGRPKGSVNKVNQEFRDTVRKLLEDNADNVAEWLQQVATGSHNGRPDPAKALDLLASLAEFAAPKLSRTELTGDGGGPVRVQQVERVIVDPKKIE